MSVLPQEQTEPATFLFLEMPGVVGIELLPDCIV